MKINQNFFQFTNIVNNGKAIISAHDFEDAQRLLKNNIKSDINDWLIDKKIGISYEKDFVLVSE